MSSTEELQPHEIDQLPLDDLLALCRRHLPSLWCERSPDTERYFFVCPHEGAKFARYIDRSKNTWKRTLLGLAKRWACDEYTENERGPQ